MGEGTCGVRGSFSDMGNSRIHLSVEWDDPTGREPERAQLGEGVFRRVQHSGRAVEGGLEVGRRLALQGPGRREVGRLGIVENSLLAISVLSRS